MPLTPLIIFAATYAGLALGRVPGLGLDRVGFAVLGGVAMIAFGCIGLGEAQAAVHAETLAVLFGMMLLSAQYRLSGLYSEIGRRLARLGRPRALLAGVIAVTALLSAVLTNDVVCFALTPLLLAAVLESRLPPVPFLIALACASNIGSGLTPIGNPQNIYIAQKMGLAFGPFVAAACVPVLLSLGLLYLLLARGVPRESAIHPAAHAPGERPLARFEAAKALILTGVAMALFFTPIPPALTALAVAGIILTSRRMHSREMLGLVDWQLLALFTGLFVVVRGFDLSGWPAAVARALADAGVDLNHPAVLTPVVSGLSSVVSNVPAVMVMEPYLHTDFATAHLLAMASTFAGNAFIVASIANIIVAQQAAKQGVVFGFREHIGVGLKVTLLSLLLTLGWALALEAAG